MPVQIAIQAQRSCVVSSILFSPQWWLGQVHEAPGQDDKRGQDERLREVVAARNQKGKNHRHGTARKRAKEEPTNVVTTRCSHHHGRRRGGSRTGVAGMRTCPSTTPAAYFRPRAGPPLACKYAPASLAPRTQPSTADLRAALLFLTPCPPRPH